ncbi:RcnB family protein [Sphingomonas sp. CJ20]
MKKTLLAAIIAATALVPPALAQDRGGRWGGGNRPDSGASNQQPAPAARENRGGWRQDGNRGPQPQRQWNGGDRGPRPDRGQFQQQQPPQAQAPQPPRQWNGGDRPDRGQWNGGPNRPDRSQWNGGPNRPDRGQWNGGPNRPDRGQWNGGPNRPDRNQWNGGPNRPDRNQWNGGPNRPDRNQWNNDRRFDRGNPGWNGRDNRGWNDRNNFRSWNDRNGGRWNNSWRNDRRYDWRGYRTSNRSLYRLPRYYAPSGWGYGYRRFSIGFTLSPLLFSQQYWINDPFYYRLPEVDGPYRWVRYYNDALLVDIYTGEVVDTIYDIFW